MESLGRLFALACVCYPLTIQATLIQYKEESISNFVASENKLQVAVVLYYETMCPHCQHFYSGDFNRTATLWSDRIDFITVPYGKATRSRSYNGTYHFECQHGPTECYGNKLHACLLNDPLGSTSLTSIHVLACVEAQEGDGDVDSHADKCGNLYNIDMKPVKECAKSALGDHLMWQYGAMTEVVNLKWVPHVVINFEHVDYQQYVPKLCAALGNPEDCDAVSMRSNALA